MPAGTVDRRVQLGVGLDLAAEGDERDVGGDAAGPQLVERALPGAAPAEQAHDHRRHAVEVGRGVEPGRIGCSHGREPVGQAVEDRPEGEQLGVGVAEEQDHAGVVSSGERVSEQSAHNAPAATEVFHHRQQVVRR